MLTRTQDEILARITARKEVDFFGFETSDYIHHLDYEHAKPYLKDGVTPDDWTPDNDPLLQMHDYMDFAWGKANDMRGLSANRTISHCIAWLWLAGEDALLEQVEQEYAHNYHYYGKPILELICDHFKWNWKQWDNGIRTNG